SLPGGRLDFEMPAAPAGAAAPLAPAVADFTPGTFGDATFGA
ncbi:MAG: hypothetical protein JWO62_112, partial [Acidimicrobiaceae bacterium]|nr:hypothetical protein [Acidimicrobiaceae bacterium]